MQNSCFPIALNNSCQHFWLDCIFETVAFYDMDNNLHFHQILPNSKPVVSKFQTRQNLLT